MWRKEEKDGPSLTWPPCPCTRSLNWDVPCCKAPLCLTWMLPHWIRLYVSRTWTETRFAKCSNTTQLFQVINLWCSRRHSHFLLEPVFAVLTLSWQQVSFIGASFPCCVTDPSTFYRVIKLRSWLKLASAGWGPNRLWLRTLAYWSLRIYRTKKTTDGKSTQVQLTVWGLAHGKQLWFPM